MSFCEGPAGGLAPILTWPLAFQISGSPESNCYLRYQCPRGRDIFTTEKTKQTNNNPLKPVLDSWPLLYTRTLYYMYFIYTYRLSLYTYFARLPSRSVTVYWSEECNKALNVYMQNTKINNQLVKAKLRIHSKSVCFPHSDWRVMCLVLQKPFGHVRDKIIPCINERHMEIVIARIVLL